MSKHSELPWVWRPNLGSGWCLTTAHGGAKVVLAACITGDYHAEITARDENGILKTITGDHPNAEFIVRACNAHDEMLDALKDIATHPLRMVKYEEWALAAIEKAEAES